MHSNHSMTQLDILRQRLNNQQISGTPFETPEEVVHWFGAVQAQEYLGSLWAIGLRLPHANEDMIEQAINSKKILRTWPMRNTIHLVPAEDAAWMLKLSEKRNTSRLRSVYRKVELDDKIFAQSADVVAKALQDGKQLTRKELYLTLEQAGIATDNSRGLHISGQLAYRGLICFGPRKGKQPTFVLLDEWAPNPRLLEGEEALAELAKRYFASHGPATGKDFAWWAGLTLTDAKKGLAMVENHFTCKEIDNQQYWFTPPTSYQEPPTPIAHLLPAFDEYTVAYKDRSVAFGENDLEKVGYGIDSNVVIGGRVIGTWKRTLKKDEVTISISSFSELSKQYKEAIVTAAKRYGTFLGKSATISNKLLG